MRRAYSLSSLAVLACLLGAAPVMAEIINLKTEAKGTNEVPPNNSAASGSLTATYDTVTKTLSWKGNYSGLTGPVTAAHFHGPAGATQNAGIALPINAANPSFEGTATLTDAQGADLLAGRWYLNIHTDTHKGGEIRGQLTK